MAETYVAKGNREVRTYAHLYHAAAYALEEAEKSEEGSFYKVMTSLTFSAFTLEAFFNHAGQECVSYWTEIERITPLQKLKVLYDIADITYDKSKRPIQTVIEVFKFRNFMAHGRTEHLIFDTNINKKELDPGENIIDTKWEQFCNLKEAQRALADVEAIIDSLAKELNLGDYPLYSFGGGTYSIQANPNNEEQQKK